MTRICSYCEKPMGYKCGKCGAESYPVPDYWWSYVRGRRFKCSNGHTHGPENPTHGICNECEGKMKEEVR